MGRGKQGLLGSVFSLGVVFFRSGSWRIGRGRLLRVMDPLYDECRKRVDPILRLSGLEIPLDVCSFSFRASKITQGLDTQRSARARETCCDGIIFHRAFYLTRVNYGFGLSSIRIWVPTLIEDGSLPDWSPLAMEFRRILEEELKGEILGDAWRSRFFAEVYPLYMLGSPFNPRIDLTPVTERLGISMNKVKLLISPLKKKSRDLLPEPKRIYAGGEALLSRDGIFLPFLHNPFRKIKTQHASSRRIRRLVQLGIDLALGLNVLLNLNYLLWDEWPLESLMAGKVALSPTVLSALTKVRKGFDPMRAVYDELIGLLDLKGKYRLFEERMVIPFDAQGEVDLIDEILRVLGGSPVGRGRRGLLFGMGRRVLRAIISKWMGDHIFPPRREAIGRMLQIIVEYLSSGEYDLESLDKRRVDSRLGDLALRIWCREPTSGLTKREIRDLMVLVEKKRLSKLANGEEIDESGIAWRIEDALERGGGGNLLEKLKSAGYICEKPIDSWRKQKECVRRGRKERYYFLPLYRKKEVGWMINEMDSLRMVMRKAAKRLGFNQDAMVL